MQSYNIVSEKRCLMIKLPEARKAVANYLTDPVVRILVRIPVAPNTMTWTGFLVVLGAAMLIFTGHLFAAGFVVLLAGFFDILDGALARSTKRTTRFGAVLDSTLDRLGEAVLLLSILLLYVREQTVVWVLLVGLALISSLLVSYIRARAEAQGVDCQVGIFTRAERVVVLVLGLLLNQLLIALAVIVAFSSITISQRLVYVWQQTKNNYLEEGNDASHCCYWGSVGR